MRVGSVRVGRDAVGEVRLAGSKDGGSDVGGVISQRKVPQRCGKKVFSTDQR